MFKETIHAVKKALICTLRCKIIFRNGRLLVTVKII